VRLSVRLDSEGHCMSGDVLWRMRSQMPERVIPGTRILAIPGENHNNISNGSNIYSHNSLRLTGWSLQHTDQSMLVLLGLDDSPSSVTMDQSITRVEHHRLLQQIDRPGRSLWSMGQSLSQGEVWRAWRNYRQQGKVCNIPTSQWVNGCVTRVERPPSSPTDWGKICDNVEPPSTGQSLQHTDQSRVGAGWSLSSETDWGEGCNNRSVDH